VKLERGTLEEFQYLERRSRNIAEGTQRRENERTNVRVDLKGGGGKEKTKRGTTNDWPFTDGGDLWIPTA